MDNKVELAKIPTLKSARLTLRPLTVEDQNDIFEYASVPAISKYLPWEPHKTINDTLAFLNLVEQEFRELNFIVLGIELNEEKKLIGTIALRNWEKSDRCIDIGYAISKKYWGKGLTTEAVNAVIKFGFEKLNANRIEAHCDEENVASYRVMEKAGMKYEGTLRKKVFFKSKFTNMRFYSILREEYFG